MNDLQERFSGLSEKALQSQLELTHLFTQEVERFLDLQYTTAKQSISQAETQLRALTAAHDLQEVLAANSEMAAQARDSTTSYVQSVYEFAAQAQSQLMRLVEAQIAAVSDAVLAATETVAPSTSVVGPVTLALVKSTVEATKAAAHTFASTPLQTATSPANPPPVNEPSRSAAAGTGNKRKKT
jgi:phasin family protein